jgi:hypothetical protein
MRPIFYDFSRRQIYDRLMDECVDGGIGVISMKGSEREIVYEI